MDDETLREFEAKISAVLFIAEAALAAALHPLSADERGAALSAILASSNQSGHLRAKDDREAEWMSDVFVRTQEQIKSSVANVAEIVGAKLASPSSSGK